MEKEESGLFQPDDIDALIILAIGEEGISRTEIQRVVLALSIFLNVDLEDDAYMNGFSEDVHERLAFETQRAEYYYRKGTMYFLTDKGKEVYRTIVKKIDIEPLLRSLR